MRLIAVLIVFLIVCAPLAAQVTVGVDTYTVEQSPSGIVIGIPRQQVLATQAGDLVVFVAGWQDRNLFLGRINGSSMQWLDTLSLTDNPLLSEADFHTHLSLDHDTIFAGLPTAGGDSMLVKIVGIRNQSLYDVAHSFTRGYRSGGGWSYYPVYRGAVWMLPGSDTAIMITRGHDGSNNDAMDVMSFVSANRGRTWGDSIRIVDLIGADDQTRIGGINYFNNTVSALIFSREKQGVLWYNWNRTTKKWVSETQNPLVGSFDRGYSGNVIRDTIQFVACCNTAYGKLDTIYYAWKTRGQTAWQHGALAAGSYSSDVLIQVNLAYIEQSKRLVMFYQQHYANAADSTRLYCRWWNATQSTWSSPTLVSGTSAAVTQFSPCLRTPSSHGDVAYASYYEINPSTGAATVRLARVRFTEVTTPCTCVGTKGNLDCSEDQLVTMSDLTAMIDHLYITLDPTCCPAETDLDGDSVITMSDMTVLIDHLFITLRPLPACP